MRIAEHSDDEQQPPPQPDDDENEQVNGDHDEDHMTAGTWQPVSGMPLTAGGDYFGSGDDLVSRSSGT